MVSVIVGIILCVCGWSVECRGVYGVVVSLCAIVDCIVYIVSELVWSHFIRLRVGSTTFS